MYMYAGQPTEINYTAEVRWRNFCYETSVCDSQCDYLLESPYDNELLNQASLNLNFEVFHMR